MNTKFPKLLTLAAAIVLLLITIFIRKEVPSPKSGPDPEPESAVSTQTSEPETIVSIDELEILQGSWINGQGKSLMITNDHYESFTEITSGTLTFIPAKNQVTFYPENKRELPIAYNLISNESGEKLLISTQRYASSQLSFFLPRRSQPVLPMTTTEDFITERYIDVFYDILKQGKWYSDDNVFVLTANRTVFKLACYDLNKKALVTEFMLTVYPDSVTLPTTTSITLTASLTQTGIGHFPLTTTITVDNPAGGLKTLRCPDLPYAQFFTSRSPLIQSNPSVQTAPKQEE
jgi:hypothetical protein